MLKDDVKKKKKINNNNNKKTKSPTNKTQIGQKER